MIRHLVREFISKEVSTRKKCKAPYSGGGGSVILRTLVRSRCEVTSVVQETQREEHTYKPYTVKQDWGRGGVGKRG